MARGFRIPKATCQTAFLTILNQNFAKHLLRFLNVLMPKIYNCQKSSYPSILILDIADSRFPKSHWLNHF